jgi:hypothetical protein
MGRTGRIGTEEDGQNWSGVRSKLGPAIARPQDGR